MAPLWAPFAFGSGPILGALAPLLSLWPGRGTPRYNGRIRDMTMHISYVRSILAALALFAVTGAADAQLFGQPRNDDTDLVARLGRLENQIRQLTGMVEELQHRNGQLEQQLKRSQQDNEFRFQEMNPSGRPPAQRGERSGQVSPPPGPPPLTSRTPDSGNQVPPVASAPQDQPPAARRGDVFDPRSQPSAPGAPRVLGQPGTPLDLGSLANAQDNAPLQRGGAGFPQQQGAPQGGAPVGQQQAVLAPSGSSRDEFDLAYGAIQRRDYDLAVDGFRVFLTNHGNSREPEAQRLVPEAHYWMGEAQFQMKKYNDSAETFLKISTDFPNAVKAPDALLRLGQSLAALGERDTACASLGHVLTKYPKASPNVKRAVEQEQKRVRC
jgi:tol-pal system protein YbgF